MTSGNHTPEILLRETTAEDLTYIKRLNYLAEVFGEESTTPDSQGFLASARFYVDAWRAKQGGFIAMDTSLDNPAGGVWIIEGDDDLHGTGYVSADIPELAIAVEKRYQGHKLGPRLIQAATELARERGFAGISLAVNLDNTRAHRLYERLGFVFHAEREDNHIAMVRRF
ncbi:GNAT family N-acetyltransferase [Corynebacterium yudongzhengii]|uniref:N-acetyltransferase n=1 Tax=Corynebacterium yudongzhengii TaxID=2080740 RepID=A0A2U1T6E2_9CORY|nr:N-acetyltransferase [Corynebacterium yudongzhengii]AWB81592.1 GNAT family N-acetyltransferase [Corynebacterium yudongzhengii]PWC01577.1 N-acetyltransferase [Corynebacterium yudongzhengii]